MSWAQQADFWLIELPAYLLAAGAAFVVGAMLLHWSLGAAFGIAVVLGMRALVPAFKRLLGRRESQ